MPKFGQFKFGEELFGEGSSSPPPTRPESVRVSWNFFDGTSSYDLLINPNEATMPTKKKRITTKSTCSGRQVIIEGKQEVPQISFSGVLLSEVELRNFKDWVSKRKQIRITDDLGQKYWVYLKTFDPTRVKNSTYPWYHTYSASGVVLDRG